MAGRYLQGAEQVCIVLLTGIGDVVHGLPVAVGIKRAHPGVKITWVAEPPGAQLVGGHPSVDDVIVFQKSAGWSGIEDLRRQFDGRRFDLTLNMQRYVKSLWPTVLSGAPVRIGLDRARVRDGVWLFSTHRLPARPWHHTQDVFLEFLDELGLELPDPLDWRLELSAAERADQAAFFAGLPARSEGPVVALALASANPVKDWPAERFGELTDMLVDEYGCTVLIVGGPSARERVMVDAVRAVARHEPRVALGDGVRRLLWLIEGSDLLVGPDSGPLHMAHAVGTPVVGIFGHTNPARFGPYAHYRDLVVDRYTVPGAEPDPSSTGVVNGIMPLITAEEVMAAVRLGLDRYVRP
jgi:heptosyltransferase I